MKEGMGREGGKEGPGGGQVGDQEKGAAPPDRRPACRDGEEAQ